jgi:hypothetical protein
MVRATKITLASLVSLFAILIVSYNLALNWTLKQKTLDKPNGM